MRSRQGQFTENHWRDGGKSSKLFQSLAIAPFDQKREVNRCDWTIHGDQALLTSDRLPSWRREPMTPFYRAGNIGFRCARSLG